MRKFRELHEVFLSCEQCPYCTSEYIKDRIIEGKYICNKVGGEEIPHIHLTNFPPWCPLPKYKMKRKKKRKSQPKYVERRLFRKSLYNV